MSNLKIRLSVIAVGMILLSLIFGMLGFHLVQSDKAQIQIGHLLLGAFIFIGLCGIFFYGIVERALNPVVNLTDHFSRIRVGDLNPRLPVGGQDEMRNMALAFNEMMCELEVQKLGVTKEQQLNQPSIKFPLEFNETNQRFLELADSAPMGIVLADPELNIVYQNTTSESGFLELSDFFTWNTEVVLGRSLLYLFPDDNEIRRVISHPDQLPYKTSIIVGPYHVRFLIGPVYNSEGVYTGPMLMWEIVGEKDLVGRERIFECLDKKGANLEAKPNIEELEEESPVEDSVGSKDMVSFETVVSNLRNLPQPKKTVNVSDEKRLSRGMELVGRSIQLLSERLTTISSMVEALCAEGDSLRRNLDVTRQKSQYAAHLTAERSEALWELVLEMNGLGERTRISAGFSKRLRKNLSSVEKLVSSITDLTKSIDHMAVEARLEIGHLGDEGMGMKVVVDEIRKLGREAIRLKKNVTGKVERVHTQVEEVLALLEKDRVEVCAGGRVARRAENALERLKRDLNDVNERTNLLAEMASGQSEIGAHIEGQLVELNELINVTVRVSKEQSRIVRKFFGKENKVTEMVIQERT